MPRILFSTVFRLGNNSSSNGVDKVILNRVVQRGTDYKLDTCDDISLRFDLLGPKGGSFSSLHRAPHAAIYPQSSQSVNRDRTPRETRFTFEIDNFHRFSPKIMPV